MSDYGVSDTGFKRKRLSLLLDELNSEVKSIFGENFNVSPESPDGQINGVISESNANLWELAEEAYNAFNPKAASGVTLSNLVQLNGITRLQATKTRVLLTLSGDPNTVIPAGSLVATADTEDQLETEEQVTIGALGTVNVFATAVVFGPVPILTGTVTEIETPVTGWDSVTIAQDGIIGTNEESDPELRARRQRSVARDAQSTLEGIRSGVENVEGVTQAVTLENDTNVEDANGLPPNSFQVIVSGGNETDIADAIWLKKPAGILAFGNQLVVIEDSQGIPHNISFSRPVEVDIYVSVTVTAFADYPSDGDERIKQAIIDYAAGDLIENRSFGLSDDVIYTRLYTPINNVQGHEIDDLQISLTSPASGISNIPIGPTEIAKFTANNIIVNS